MEKHIITKDGVKLQDEALGKETPSMENELNVVKKSFEEDARRAMEASKDISNIKFALGIHLNDDMILFESVAVDKKVGFEFAEKINDSDLFDKMFYEHPYKGKVVECGRIRSKKIKVKPGDYFYYDPSMKHNIFMYNNKKYLIGYVAMVIGTLEYKESFINKLKRRIKEWTR